MSTIVVNRLPRRAAPEIPTGDLRVEAPPQIPRESGSRWRYAVQLLPMLAGTVATALLFAGRDGGVYSYVIGGVFGVSTLGMLATSWSGAGPRKAEMTAARREYLRHLAQLRRRVRDTATRQRAGLLYRHPDPGQLWSTVDSHRIWERRPGDADFGVVRIAVGPQALATSLVAPATGPADNLEPLTSEALRGFLDAYSVVPDLPVAISVPSFARVFVRGAGPAARLPGGAGADDSARGLVRAILAQLSVFHAPDDLLLAFCVAPQRRAGWEWVKWLPHALHPTRTDAAGRIRLLATTGTELEDHLDDLLANRDRFATGDPTAGPVPRLIVVLDGGDLTGGRQLNRDRGVAGVTLIDLDTAPPRQLDRSMIVLDPSGPGRPLRTATADDAGTVGVADSICLVEAEALARRLAPLRLAARGDADLPDPVGRGPADLLGLGDPYSLDPVRSWAAQSHRARMRVPIGIGPDGNPVELDLKESAQDGMGPHGLVIGATGSGKSELLRTLVLGLAATHSSELLNFVLIDFKGGATFACLDRLPHVAAMITNLADALPLVDRAIDAINGELVRRQELLHRTGNHSSVRDYERARAGGAALAPLPSLLIVCDEFSELLTARPDFIDLFLQIGRLGRSLGVHLLLASQRLEEGRLRGLDTHLSYRIGLRTFSALESRTVLGVADAYELPRSPGHGYLRYGTEPLVRFRAAYVSGPYERPRPCTVDAHRPGRSVLDYSTHHAPAPTPEPTHPAAAESTSEADPASLLEIVVARLAGRGVPAHQVWLPPLSTPPGLDQLLGPVGPDPAWGLSVGNPQLRGALRVPVALVDKPYEQRRDVLWLQLDGSAGHVAVVGGPQSGKSTALRTLVVGLALTHTPRQAQAYCLDFGGGQLAALRALPHVGGVAGRLDQAAVRRTVGELVTLLADRERRFAATGVGSMAGYRRQRATATSRDRTGGPADEDRFGDVFLVVDGWSTLRSEYDDLEPIVLDLATRGLSYGIHVVATASRWLDFRPAIRDLFGSRLELRLGDPSDSAVSRKAAANVPERLPGRGITAESLHLITALPELATVPDPTGDNPTGDNLARLVRAISDCWTGPTAPLVRLLPATVRYREIADSRDEANPLALPIGLAEADLRPAYVDFAGEPHFLLFGDAECGKSSFLRALAATITARFTPEQARIILVDYRRSLLGAIGSGHLIGYGSTAAQTLELTGSVARYMRGRLPGQEITAEQLRARSWWSGPECFVLVDDYDLVATGPTNPITPLLEFLAQARDIGLHLVLTRRSGGAGRALYEPVIQRLRELSSPGLVMSGDRDEGPLLGNVRPTAAPAGRGSLVTRKDGVRLIQLAHMPYG